MPGHTAKVECIAATSDNRYIVSGSCDYTVRIWNTLENAQVDILNGHMSPVKCITVTADNRFIVSGSSDQTVRIWNLQMKKKKRQEVVLQVVVQVDTDKMQSIAITNNIKYIVSGFKNATVRIWKLA